MKLVSVFVVATVLAAVGAACGPEQPYCYNQHKTCAQAKLDNEQADRAQKAAAAAAAADAGASDSGTIIID
jgi:hypothetical protein